MAVKISGIYINQEITDIYAELGWQCPECYGVQVKTYQKHHKFGGTSEDRFECQECGNIWHRE